MMKFVINPKYSHLESFVSDLPQNFKNSGDLFFKARNTIRLFDVFGHKINAKKFKIPNIINQIAYSLIRPSKAKRSFEYASKLKDKGFNTPDPVAYIETKSCGLLKDSFYLSIHEDFDGLMQVLQRGTVKDHQKLLQQFALFTASLHENKILHLDYSSANILYKIINNDYVFYLVDLNRMRFNKVVDIDTACQSFKRIWGSDSMIEYIVREYASKRGFSEDVCVREVFNYRQEFWGKFAKRHPDMTPYINN